MKPNTPTNRRRHRTRLLRHTILGEEDAARLVLEAVEELRELADVPTKKELLILLRRVVHTGIAAVRKAQISASFAQAVQESLESRAGRRPLTLRDLRYYTRRMLRIEGLAERSVRSLSVAECRSILDTCFGGSLHSYRKGRAILHSIFAYAQRREWVDKNPVDCIEVPNIIERPIHPLSITEISRLEETARSPEHRAMQLSLHLMLYCGVRPNEVRRLNPSSDIDWSRRQVLIRPQSSKTGGGRIIPLRKARLIRGDSRCTIPGDWEHRWHALRVSAGFDTWQADVCRHTFATYHAQRFRNIPQLQMEMGHRSASLLRTRYIMAQLGSDAKRFWQ